MGGRPNVGITLTQRWHRVPGGTATVVERLVDAMATDSRVDLSVIEPRGDVRRPKSVISPGQPGPWTSPVPVYNLSLPLPFLYESWTRLGYPTVSSAVDHLDLVHLTVPIAPPTESVPLVATVHDLFPLTRPELMTERGARLMRAGLEAIRDRADRVIVFTNHLAEECVSFGFDTDKLRVIPPGITAVEDDSVVRAEVLSRHGIRAPFILFVGTLEPRKNLALLLEAMVRLSRPDISLVLAGPAGWGAALGDRRSPKLEDLPCPVIRLGFVPESDLAHLQRAATAFCFPSLAEGFGLPVLEAMAAGAAVITSKGTATAEVAGNAALLVDPTDADDLVSALESIIGGEETSQRLRLLGKARSAEFTWERASQETIDVYLEVLS